ncbi:hypothetical protein FC756_25170 [Lysinibacillus mangiferihumi]|uniref:Uncharacterized protein n=1 Tax=Lysinibacillus mangiferihumi TaxID=1130819 RepID=A0A4U2Y131_9BACI|nr:HNH/endonuclease VII fold putative polymorphic toxin [Lysinibacillus mangiferihumi]TKI53212.1 hypothetical protein FC756_25170 [Lysinibacillus mangiferihumi]
MENEHVTIKLERDPSGQVIKEWQNDHWITSSYDELGNRSQITSSLGAKIDVTRNELGNVLQISNKTAHGRYYEFTDAYGEKKVTVLHTNDPNPNRVGPTHAHAGMVHPADTTKRRTMDFKNQENKYFPINDPKGVDHHLEIKCRK